ncbi:MAG: hypothetical protein K0R10_1064 [Alphaproteobacteria bacterium]|jgi:hypothetical protein|nr:hypothetical protein [Alphaproteobacteria bacterium]
MTAPKKSLSESFKAVAVYDVGPKENPTLADFKQVVAGVRGPQKVSMFLKDLPSQVAPDFKMTPELRTAMQLLTRTHASGFSLTVVEAAHKGKKVFLPVIDDKVAGKTLIIGPAAIADGIAGPNTVYIAANEAGAAKAVNDFLKSGATLRGDQGLLKPAEVKGLIENFFQAVGLVVEPGGKRAKSLGDFLVPVATGETPVVAYSLAVKNPQPAKPAAR